MITPPAAFKDLNAQIRFTPTFIVQSSQGKEMLRIQGYRGEEYFWNDIETLAEQMQQDCPR
ncbi:hypothetical protein [Magnetofaba australis]|uniref:hypothetical protein n=1 Tax=Magnetofaba australis TaxID=1472297 RepID=UPI000A19E1C3|nr:hypothetical protein [Magnetofaba australis]